MTRRLRGEDGASLLLAIGFLTLAAVFIPALLDLGTTNLVDTSRLNELRGSVYAADAATDEALQYLRSKPGCGQRNQQPGTGPLQCPTPPYTGPSTSQFQVTLNNKTAITTVTGVQGTGCGLCLDRTVTLDTAVDGRPFITARAIIRDSTPCPPAGCAGFDTPIDVVSWTYQR